ncbi:MAG: CaiB/BaiF CoA transferase family protein [Kiloniellales bacterium]
MTAAGPLDGVLVVDLTRVLAGPYCTMVLVDLGARVIKVEVPGRGDDARQYGPFVNGKSVYFMSLNRGKESIALDLKSDADRPVFERLLERADVLVENFRAGTMERLGYGWDSLHERYPRLVYAAASGFGHTGPYAGRPAYDIVAQGMGGIMSLTGEPGGPPLRVGTSVGDITAGLYAAIGIGAALTHRAQTGAGIKLDVAMLDCQVAILENAIARFFATGKSPGPQGARNPSIAPFEPYEAADGYMILAAGNDALFRRLAEVLGCPELADDPRFLTNTDRTANVAELKAALDQALKARPRAEWLELLDAAGIPCGPINNIEEVVNDRQIAARTMLVRTDDPVAGERRMVGNPIKMSAFADPDTRSPAPELDQHRQQILRELDILTPATNG